MKRCILLILVLTALTACGHKKTEKQNASVTPDLTLRIPEPPAILDQEQKIVFLKDHFWDNFDFEDEKYPFLLDSAQIHSLFTDYASLLMSDPYDTVSTAILMEKASGNPSAFALFTEMAEVVFHGENSPYRNDEFYIPVLRAELQSPYLNDDEKIRPAAELESAQLNRLGHKANDFQYVTERLDRAELIRAADETSENQSESALAAAGKGIHKGPETISHLYDIDADYTLLFFNNPGCAMCRDIKTSLMNSEMICSMVKNGTLVILAVYPDENLDAWRAYHPYLPKEWVNARNPGSQILNDNIYNLNAIPSLYLLDKGKTVLAKDETDVKRLEKILKKALASTQDQQGQ